MRLQALATQIYIYLSVWATQDVGELQDELFTLNNKEGLIFPLLPSFGFDLLS